MKYGVLTAALTLSAALGSPGALAAADPGAGPDLALRRVLLSSGGVGYFEYEATLEGEADLRLSVRRDQVDDVLKSVVVFDDAGNLGEVSLAGKELASEAFRDLTLPEGALDSPAALLSALRGAEVRVETPSGGAFTGRIVAVTEEQVKQPGGETVTRHRLTLLAAGAVRQVVVEEIASLTLIDAALQADLDAALDALSRQRERDRRELTVHLDGAGARVVRVGYVAEVPLWKSTYRLVLPPPSGSAEAALTSFAVVENRTGEDWSDVDLTLVAGNPVTFRQAIYDTYYVNRPSVPVEVLGRVLPRPDEGGVGPVTENDDETKLREEPAPGGWGAGGLRFGAPHLHRGAPQIAPVIPAEGSQEASQAVFHLPSPVSLESGRTALLPMLSLSLPAPRLSLYQSEIDARHPLSSIEVANGSGVDLPPGVLAIYERARAGNQITYAGDAQLPLLPNGKSRFVSYAVDLRVTVDRDEEETQTVTLAKVAGGTLTLTRTDRKKTTYTLAGAPDEARTVILEHPRIAGYELAASDEYQVVDMTAARYRLRREVPAGATVKIEVVLERPRAESVSLTDLPDEKLGVYATSTELPMRVREALQRIIDLRADVTAQEITLSQKNAERARILEDQARLRDNLKAIPAGSALAEKYLARLDDQEARLSALDQEIAAAESAVKAAREVLAAEIRRLRS